jgi:hypothetical protein
MFEEFIRNGTTVVGMVFMPVYAAEFNRLPVDEEDAVFELGIAESNALVHVAGGVGEDEVVQVGRFSGPLVGVGDGDAEGCARVGGLR